MGGCVLIEADSNGEKTTRRGGVRFDQGRIKRGLRIKYCSRRQCHCSCRQSCAAPRTQDRLEDGAFGRRARLRPKRAELRADPLLHGVYCKEAQQAWQVRWSLE